MVCSADYLLLLSFLCPTVTIRLHVQAQEVRCLYWRWSEVLTFLVSTNLCTWNKMVIVHNSRCLAVEHGLFRLCILSTSHADFREVWRYALPLDKTGELGMVWINNLCLMIDLMYSNNASTIWSCATGLWAQNKIHSSSHHARVAASVKPGLWSGLNKTAVYRQRTPLSLQQVCLQLCLKLLPSCWLLSVLRHRLLDVWEVKG